MGTRDARIDAYIASSADFAKPILSYLRETVHEACPAVEEAWKWSSPHFTYHGMLCSMAAFKRHCAFGFWKGALVIPGARDATAMGSFERITRRSDLPPKGVLLRHIRKAMQLNEAGVQAKRPRPKPRGALVVPPELKRGLLGNKKAQVTFERFSPSHRREYIEWITEAKRDETRLRRLESAIKWMAEGKPRHWRYLT